jgi:hypothetical protein
MIVERKALIKGLKAHAAGSEKALKTFRLRGSADFFRRPCVLIARLPHGLIFTQDADD